MSGFAALMALSASQTKQVQSAVESALEQRRRNEQVQRKKREEQERKIREQEAKLRQKRFDDEKREREQEALRQAELAKRLADQARREEEARNALLYGPSRRKWPTSSHSTSSHLREDGRAGIVNDNDDDERSIALTREEKRQRRVEAEMRRTYQLKRAGGMHAKSGRRLPGGALDTTSAPSSSSSTSSQSVKARLAALPNTLTKLNVNKRDTRTIDEILQDRAKAKNLTLDGDDAREFNDWFGKAKKKDVSPQKSPALSVPTSGKTTPPPPPTKVSSQRPKSQSVAKAAAVTTTTTTARPPKSPKKRPRSRSFDSPPPPSKRRAPEQPDISSEIWKLFGKDKHKYMMRDVLSDDEDMEVNADEVMKEEMQSARWAKREDELALEEEKRHEEEKRRRKREREKAA